MKSKVDILLTSMDHMNCNFYEITATIENTFKCGVSGIDRACPELGTESQQDSCRSLIS